MNYNIDEIIKEYEINKANAQKYDSFINNVTGYKEFIFKEFRLREKLLNEEKWLKKLMGLNFNSPEYVGTHDNTIITKKIDGEIIDDYNANEHLYNIGALVAKLHKLPYDEKSDWKDMLLKEYKQLKDWAKDLMEPQLYEKANKFLDNGFEKLEFSNISIIHRDLRPANVMLSNGEYYLIDFESMCIGDQEFDFTRIFNRLNQIEKYTYEDIKNYIDGYRSINSIKLSDEKWHFYNVYYAFRIYTRILVGLIDKDVDFENYLKSILDLKPDKIIGWIQKYNIENSL